MAEIDREFYTRITFNHTRLFRLLGYRFSPRLADIGIMRMLQVGDRPTRLAQALAEFGWVEKTLHMLNYIDDESRRRAILTQLNRGQGRLPWQARRTAPALPRGPRGSVGCAGAGGQHHHPVEYDAGLHPARTRRRACRRRRQAPLF